MIFSDHGSEGIRREIDTGAAINEGGSLFRLASLLRRMTGTDGFSGVRSMESQQQAIIWSGSVIDFL
ncbi:hypothetical protein [Andreprevotia sp. IGB-42]|uniref:hypothetical protein n=1 Tax=Andreprevotia sp. IGB-42 TaxID=2497473 RepID=UPI00135C353E|nr:hypothetical protein [Andreprevotia sp. IGB-42]